MSTRGRAARTINSPPTPALIPYPDQWRAFTAEEKDRLTGGQGEEMDLFLEQLPDMDDAALGEWFEQEHVMVEATCARIAAVRAHLDRLVAERNRQFIRLVMAGESQGSLARRAGLRSPMAVSFAIGASKKRSRQEDE